MGCAIVYTANGKVSQLYKQLQKRINNRPLANLIYASYLQVGAQMDAQGIARDIITDEHNINDVIDFLHVNDITRELATTTDDAIAKAFNMKDSSGNMINYTTAETAMQVADNYNQTNGSRIASVIKAGTAYNVVLNPRDSKNYEKQLQINRDLHLWNKMKDAFSNVGLDINNFYSFMPDMIDPSKISDLLNYFQSLKTIPAAALTIQDIKAIFTLGSQNSVVSNYISRIGDIDSASQKTFNFFQGTPETPGMASLIQNAIQSRSNYPLDINTLKTQLQQEEQNYNTNSDYFDISETIKNLNRKYSIDATEINKTSNDIQSLQDASVEAITTLQRQVNELRRTHGDNIKGQQLESLIDNLLIGIEQKQYYSGLLSFLQEALNHTTTISDNLNTIESQRGTFATEKEYLAAVSKVLVQYQQSKDMYLTIVTALSNIEQLNMDQALTDQDKQNLKNMALNILNIFNKKAKTEKDLRRTTMVNICTEVLGQDVYNALGLTSAIDMSSADSSIFDNLYSWSRVSNPLIATMGTITRRAQIDRDAKMREFSERIRGATNKLRKAKGNLIGVDTSFMYTEDGHLLSDIDWQAYGQAKRQERKRLKKLGNKGFKLKEALEQWEINNTEERVVDYVSGRTERVPIQLYRFPINPVDNLDVDQREYYDTMMQIKGEIGSILPAYAQQQYRAPQIRKSWIDVITDTVRNKGSMKTAMWQLWDRMKFLKIREDDMNFAINGIITDENEEVINVASDYDNTPLQQIPIFYFNNLKSVRDKDGNIRVSRSEELLRDFSTALQHLSATATNYEAMNNVFNVIQFMADYIKKGDTPAKDLKDRALETIIEGGGIKVLKRLNEKSGGTANDIINSFIQVHYYGEKIKKEHQTWPWRLLKSMIAYTSLKSLVVNVKGAMSNYLVGEAQMLIETGLGWGGEFYNVKDYIHAHNMLFKDNTYRAGGRIMDFLQNDKTSLPVLLQEVFDPMQDSYSDNAYQRYHSSAFRQLFGGFNVFGQYAAGEYLIHYVTMYAMMNHQKVLYNGENRKFWGKKFTLLDVFDKQKNPNGSYSLVIKPGFCFADDVVDSQGNVIYRKGDALPTDINDIYYTNLRENIRHCNQNTHGSMNEEDKGIIHRNMLGRSVMNLRQWMIEHYSRRYRGKHFDASSGRVEEGYWRTAGRFMRDFALDAIKFHTETQARWDKMNNYQKANCKRALAEIELWGMLMILSLALGDPDKHRKEWWRRMWIYQCKRALQDENAALPWGLFTESKAIIKSPASVIGAISGVLYPITGIADIDEKVKKGRHKGENKYFYYTAKYTLPFYNQIDQLIHMDDEDNVFSVFGSANSMR